MCDTCHRMVTYVTITCHKLHNTEKIIKDSKIDNII